jgi:hypothetical protein
VAHLAVTPAHAGAPTSLDASASTVAFGTISSFAWNFGDGSNATTTTPITTHIYASAGTFTASVTETSSGGTSTTQVFTGQTMTRNGGPSAVASQTFTLPTATTTTSLSSSVNPSVVGQSVTYTATVSPTPTGGTVDFTDNGSPISGCSAVSLSGGSATCTVTYGATGSHSIVASYSGFGTFAGSASSALTQIVTRTPCLTLAGCNLRGLNLSGANLANSDLSGANLSGANLTNSDLTGANLQNANLNGANLTNANLTGANLTGANLKNATLTGVKWNNTICPDGTNSDADGGTCLGHLLPAI